MVVNFDLSFLESIIYAFFFALVRCSIFITTLPLVGSKSLPGTIKVLFIFILSLVGGFIIQPELGSIMREHSVLSITASQVLIGLIMGFIFRLVFEMFELAGRLISMASGFGFADQPGFASNQKNSMIGSLLYIFISLVFIASDGINLFVSTVFESFFLIHIPWSESLQRLFPDVISWMAGMFIQGMMLGLPVVSAVWGCTLMLSVLNKAAPALQVISVGFPLYIVCAIYFLWLTNPARNNDAIDLFESMHSLIFITLRGLSV